MTSKQNLSLFFVTLALTFYTWYLLIDSSSLSLNARDRTSSKLEKVRNLGIGENPVDIRRAVEFPEWLRTNLTELTFDLKDSISSRPPKLSPSESLEIIKLIGSFGTRAAFATSTIITALKSSNDQQSEFNKQALLALYRVAKAPESVEGFLRENCSGDVLQITEHTYSCFILKKLGLEVSPVTEKSLDKFTELNLKEVSVTIDTWIKDQKMILDSADALIYPLCIYASTLKGESIDLAYNTYQNILSSSLSSHIKISTLRCAADFSPLNSAILDKISYLMQFDNDSIVRREALLTLLQYGSERSLELAKAYGHKFLNGEPAPETIEAHPFRQWYLDKSEVKSN